MVISFLVNNIRKELVKQIYRLFLCNLDYDFSFVTRTVLSVMKINENVILTYY
jgi:hypothetical protein